MHTKKDLSFIKIKKRIALLFACIAGLITYFVLFIPPMPGVADQGDFSRVMSMTGLEQIQNPSKEVPAHWFKFITTQYSISSFSIKSLLGFSPTTSMVYPITIAKGISALKGVHFFSTTYLAFVYGLDRFLFVRVVQRVS